MRVYSNKLLTALLFFFPVLQVFSQDPQFSQYYANQILLNPALTGAAEGPRVAMNYRRQWVQIPGSFKTFAFAYDQPVDFGKTSHGVGLSFMSDVAGEGDLTKLDVMFNYSYRMPLTKAYKRVQHTIRMGLAGGFQQSSLDFFKLRFPDQIDARDGVIFNTQETGFSETHFVPDISTGFAYYNNYSYLSVTVNHLTEPDQRFYSGTLPDSIDPSLPRKITVTGGVNLPIGPHADREKYTLTPVFIYKTQGTFDQIDLGAYFHYEPVVFGAYYRGSSQVVNTAPGLNASTTGGWGSDAFVGLIGWKKGILSVGYSYDYTISKLTNRISGGSHEIAMVLEFERNKKTKFRHRKFPCPRY